MKKMFWKYEELKLKIQWRSRITGAAGLYDILDFGPGDGTSRIYRYTNMDGWTFYFFASLIDVTSSSDVRTLLFRKKKKQRDRSGCRKINN